MHQEQRTERQQWKNQVQWHPDGYYALETSETAGVPVRLFLDEKLLRDAEHTLYAQIVQATRFPGTKLVVITPDAHHGYGVPVGCVIVTDVDSGAVAMGPVGFDIGCGMISARSGVLAEEATAQKRLEFNREVLERVAVGMAGSGRRFGMLDRAEFNRLVRGGADYYVQRHGVSLDRSCAERQCIPVEDSWDIPFGGPGKPERGMSQLGTLGGGNHFIELQRSEQTQTLFVQIHTGSRGFGHGLATNYFHWARMEWEAGLKDIDLGYFTPDSKYHGSYLNAVAAGGNFAIVNRLVIFEEVAAAFRKVFRADLELVYEISHNLVQQEWHPDFGMVWVHRKGATRAFPAGHPGLVGTRWEQTGHPVLIPGSNKDYSYILRPQAGAVHSAFSVNHGAGRRLSRTEARQSLAQSTVNREYQRAGVLVNTDGAVPLDEAAACYKSSEQVVDVVVQAGLATVEHRLWPLSSIKGAEETDHRGRKKPDKKKPRQQETPKPWDV